MTIKNEHIGQVNVDPMMALNIGSEGLAKVVTIHSDGHMNVT